MLLISHYGNAVLLMGLNACSGSLSFGDLSTETQRLKTIWLDTPSCPLFICLCLLCLVFMCARGSGLLIHVKTSQPFEPKTVEGMNFCDFASRMKKTVLQIFLLYLSVSHNSFVH